MKYDIGQFFIWVGPEKENKYNILCQVAEMTSNSIRMFCYKKTPKGVYCHNWVTDKDLESKNYEILK